jgi:nitrogen fixation protein FixH
MGARLLVRRLLAAALLALGLLGLAGCVALPALAPDQERRQQRVEGLTVTLDTLREPLVNQTQPFRVTLSDESGRPVEGAQVFVDLEMDMICIGQGTRIADEVSPGRYEATSVYPMAGEWRVNVIVRLGDEERKAPFAVTVAEAGGEGGG